MAVRAWRYDMEGVTGHSIPIYFLDTNLEQNDPIDRTLTDHLYGGDADYRLRQEAILGIGGARMLRALEYEPTVYHMNEGPRRAADHPCAGAGTPWRRFADCDGEQH